MVGEIGGAGEEMAADYIRETHFPKKVTAFVAGTTAPSEKRMGHAGAVISGGFGSAASKLDRLKKAGVQVVSRLDEILSS